MKRKTDSEVGTPRGGRSEKRVILSMGGKGVAVQNETIGYGVKRDGSAEGRN